MFNSPGTCKCGSTCWRGTYPGDVHHYECMQCGFSKRAQQFELKEQLLNCVCTFCHQNMVATGPEIWRCPCGATRKGTVTTAPKPVPKLTDGVWQDIPASLKDSEFDLSQAMIDLMFNSIHGKYAHDVADLSQAKQIVRPIYEQGVRYMNACSAYPEEPMNQEPKKFDKPGVYRTHKEGDNTYGGGFSIESLTGQGWELVEALPVEEAISSVRCGRCYNCTSGCGGICNTATSHGVEAMKLRKTYLFILRKNKESVLAEKEEKIQHLKKLNDGFNEKLRDFAKLEKEIESQRHEIQNLRAEIDEDAKSHSSLRKSNLKMEQDLGKLREHLGSKAFKEIVGEK